MGACIVVLVAIHVATIHWPGSQLWLASRICIGSRSLSTQPVATIILEIILLSFKKIYIGLWLGGSWFPFTKCSVIEFDIKFSVSKMFASCYSGMKDEKGLNGSEKGAYWL